jgi:cytoskeletal protein RodZ
VIGRFLDTRNKIPTSPLLPNGTQVVVMKMLAGYLLAIVLVVGGYLGALSWLTTQPAPPVARKQQSAFVAKAEAEPVKAVEEVVTFPEAPPRPAVVAEAMTDQTAQTTNPQTKSVVVPSGPSPTSSFARFQPEPKAPVRTASKKKAKPRYEVMIQRTVQMPDGRIVQKLIPLSRKEADAYAQYR